MNHDNKISSGNSTFECPQNGMSQFIFILT